jgi:hypothetical protein
MTPMILGKLHGNMSIRIANFEVLVSLPLLGLASQVVGHSSLLLKTPSRTGAQVEPFVDRSSVTALST